VENSKLAHLELLLALKLITFYKIVMGAKYHDSHCLGDSGVIAGAVE
jgi:hypothetical protein